MPDHPNIDALRTIEARDPNAGSVQPTDADHAAHKRWAVDTYGPDVWRTYVGEPWGLHGTDPV